MDFSLVQIAIVLVIALLVFGPKRLPELGRSLGSGMREFRETISGMGEDATRDSEESEQVEQTSAARPETDEAPGEGQPATKA
jgi:sec-independent protein translocase protein TatA